MLRVVSAHPLDEPVDELRTGRVVKMRKSPQSMIPRDHAVPFGIPEGFPGYVACSARSAFIVVELVPLHADGASI